MFYWSRQRWADSDTTSDMSPCPKQTRTRVCASKGLYDSQIIVSDSKNFWKKEIFDRTVLRKFCGFTGLIPGCILICLINVVGCNTTAVVAFITVSSAALGISGAAIAPNYADLAPPYAGLIHGLCDTLKSCAGFIIPIG